MSEEGRWALPSGWAWARAAEFSKVVGGGTPKNAKQPDNYSTDGIPWITPADLSGYNAAHISRGGRDLSEKGFKSCSARMLPKGTVLLSSRAPVGYCVVASNDVCTNQGFKSFVLRSEELVPEFLRYYLIGSKQYLESEASGTTFLELAGGRAEQLQFPIAPAQEQVRIVSKIDELFSQIEEGERALERVQKLVERYRQSLLKAAVTGELTREWRERHKGRPESGDSLLARILETRRSAWEKAELAKMKAKGIEPANDKWKQKYQEPSLPNTTELPRLPAGWTWASLPILSSEDAINGISVKGSNTPPGVSSLRLDAMIDNGFDYAAKRYIPIGDSQARRLSIREGDFFVSRANGSLALVGRAVLAQEPPGLVVFPDTMIRYRLISSPGIRDWITKIWPSRLVRSRIEQRAKTTAGIYKISQNDISEIYFPVPPSEERAAILSTLVERLAQGWQLDKDMSGLSKTTQSLRQAVLATAFSGRLTPRDGADEPASVLLVQIDTQRRATAQGRAPKVQIA